MSDTEAGPEACPYVAGAGAFSALEARVWLGLLRAHRQLVRELDASLDRRHGLSLSALELLGRLADEPDRQLRLSRLAASSGLSLSRVSRLVDELERRRLVERHPCPDDARAINARLTGAGATLAREAQATHAADVQARVFQRLDDTHLEALAEAFARLAPEESRAADAA